MSAPNRSWPGYDPTTGDWKGLWPATDAEAEAAGLCKVDVGGVTKYLSPVDAKELVKLGQGTILAWPPGTVGAN